MARRFKKILGIVLAGFSALGLLGLMNPNKPVNNPGGAAIILGLMGLGAVALLWPSKKVVKQANEAIEQQVLEVMRQQRGRVTATEVAAATPMNVEESERELARLEKLGVCRSQISERGVLLYYFPEFADPATKSQLFFSDSEEDARRQAQARIASESAKTRGS